MDSFSQYFKNSSNINNSFISNKKFTSNNINNVVKFMVDNIVWFLVAVFIGVIIFYIVYFIREKKNNPGPKKVKSNYNVYRVDDELKHNPIGNQILECPRAINQYSFTFFLEINDTYCDSGYWKAIMIKGQELNRKIKSCKSGFKIESKKEPDNCFENYENTPDDKLAEYIQNMKDNKLDLGNVADLNKRVHLICKAHKLNLENKNQEGTNQLCHAFSNCDILTGEITRMSEGQCANFIDQHRDYCNFIYQVDKKVARNSDRELSEEKSFFDEYDNICSYDNLYDKYPELLPRNLDIFKDIKLINTAEKMDIENGESREDKSLEGCYDYTNTDIITLVDDITQSLSDDYGAESIRSENILQSCNRYSLGKYNYFGISNDKCFSLDLLKEDELEDLIKGGTNIRADDCGGRTPTDTSKIYLSKALRPEESILLNCWETVIGNYPTQNPGVWLHPFINDLRVVLTTSTYKTENDYSQYVNEMIHPFKETELRNLKNYNIKPLDVDEHPGVSNAQEYSKCSNEQMNISNKKYYREYFDVKNIPIKENFHLGIVINENTVEIYINGDLNTTQVLFGKPNYNSGPLHISPGIGESKELKLNGIISDFKYYNKSLNYQNIRNVMNEKSVIIQEKNKDVESEHTHSVDVEHEHDLEDVNHQHGLYTPEDLQ